MTPVEKTMVFQGADIFRETRPEVLTEVGAIAEEETFEQGEVIFHEDDPPEALYAVVSGRVQLKRGSQEIKIVGPREIFGAWAAFDGQPRMVTATAVDRVRVLKVSYEDFYDLLLDNMEIGQAVFKMLARQIRELTR